MRILYKVLTLIMVGFLISSCSDFLEEKPLISQTEGNYFNDELNAISAVNACYDPLTWGQSGVNLPSDFSHAYEWIFGDVMSDDAVKGSTSSDIPEIAALERWEATSNNGSVANLWYNPFTGIYRTNIVINNIGAGNIDEDLKNRLMGEAKFLRGYYYFLLVRTFGGVPIFEEPLTPEQIKANDFSKGTIGEVYAFINQNFLEAIDLLPEKSAYAVNDAGRATKGAARAYLARAYMYQIGTDNSNEITWDDVFGQTNAIIQSGEYGLTSNYASIFEMESENNIESIFEIQAIDDVAPGFDKVNGSSPDAGIIDNVFMNPFALGGYGFDVPRQDLYDEFEEGDPRRESTIFVPGDFAFGLEIDVFSGDRSPTGLLNRKVFFDPATVPSNLQNGNQNIRKFRYADVILMQAEAEYYRGNAGEAIRLVNEIRNRARNSTYPKGYSPGNPTGYDPTGYSGNLPPLPGSLSGENLLHAIWHERRVEFGMEQLRYWDLIRTGRYMESLEEEFDATIRSNAMSHSITSGVVNPVPLAPIPATDVAAWGLTPNPGY